MRFTTKFPGRAFWPLPRWLAQQSQFQGSVPRGTASSTPLALTLHDAIDRGLKANLGLLVSDSTSETARGQRLQALSALLPQLHAPGRRDDRAAQPENDRIQFQDSGSFHPDHCRSVSLHRRARLRVLERLRLQRPQELSLGAGEQARRAALREGRARPGGSSHGQRLSSDHCRRFPRGSDSLPGGDRAGAVRPRRRSAKRGNRGRHRRSAVPGGIEAAATAAAGPEEPVRQGQTGARPRDRASRRPGIQSVGDRAVFAAHRR